LSKVEKLLDKLRRDSIDAAELRTLLGQLGWIRDRTKGSHEIWINHDQKLILATHSKDLKRYQIKQAKALLLTEEEHEKNQDEQQDGY